MVASLPASCRPALLPPRRCPRARHLLAKERDARPVSRTALLSSPSLLCLASRAGHTARCAATSAEVTTYSVVFLHGVVQPWYGWAPVLPTRCPSARACAIIYFGGSTSIAFCCSCVV